MLLFNETKPIQKDLSIFSRRIKIESRNTVASLEINVKHSKHLHSEFKHFTSFNFQKSNTSMASNSFEIAMPLKREPSILIAARTTFEAYWLEIRFQMLFKTLLMRQFMMFLSIRIVDFNRSAFNDGFFRWYTLSSYARIITEHVKELIGWPTDIKLNKIMIIRFWICISVIYFECGLIKSGDCFLIHNSYVKIEQNPLSKWKHSR